jgi:urea transport system permease protein
MITGIIFRSLDRGAIAFLVTLAAIGVLVPVLNLVVPASSPFHLSSYFVALFGKYLCYAILALSIDLIWGYCGILSLGHGAFFALGGYAMGMYLMRQIGTRGVYANPVLPDFMVFLNWPELPIYWYGFQHFAYAAFMVLFVPGLLAFVFGWFAFRSRVTGVYLSIITQALTFALMLGFFRNNFGFGGNNGLTDFKDILGFNVQAPGTRAALLVASTAMLMIGFIICRVIVSSKLGKVLVAIRDAEARTRFLGYRVEAYKLFVFTLSACMAGVAGALYVPQVGIINPSEFSPANSIEAVIWVAVGGRGTLTGAVLGAILVNYGKTFFTSGTLVPYWGLGVITLAVAAAVVWKQRQALIGIVAGVVIAIPVTLLLATWTANAPFMLAGLFVLVAMGMSWHSMPLGAIFGVLLFGFFATPYTTVALAPYWLFLLGGLFIAVTLLLPRGIVGTIHHWWGEWQARRQAAASGAARLPAPAPRAAE